MKTLTKILILLFFCVYSTQTLYSQDLKKSFDASYGLNSKLYNGYIYSGNYGNKVKGQAFLYQQFDTGSIVLDGKKYDQLLLNYDIYNQLLILKFKDISDADIFIEIPFFKLSEFSIGSDLFQLKTQSDSSYKVYQIIGEKPYQFWLTHQKNLNVETTSDQYDYQFSRNFINIYLLNDKNHLFAIKNNKSLYQYTDKDKLSGLKKWLRKEKFKLQKASAGEIELLSNFIHQL